MLGQLPDMIWKRLFLLLLVILPCRPVLAQQGSWGIGFRGSIDGAALNVKHFVSPQMALLAQVSAGGRWLYEGQSFVLSSYVLYHLPLPMPQIRLFFGGGGHFGAWLSRSRTPADAFIAGIDGMGGVEFISLKNPLSLALDIKPSINFLDRTEYFPHNMAGLSLRYYFAQRKRQPPFQPKPTTKY